MSNEAQTSQLIKPDHKWTCGSAVHLWANQSTTWLNSNKFTGRLSTIWSFYLDNWRVSESDQNTIAQFISTPKKYHIWQDLNKNVEATIFPSVYLVSQIPWNLGIIKEQFCTWSFSCTNSRPPRKQLSKRSYHSVYRKTALLKSNYVFIIHQMWFTLYLVWITKISGKRSIEILPACGNPP